MALARLSSHHREASLPMQDAYWRADLLPDQGRAAASLKNPLRIKRGGLEAQVCDHVFPLDLLCASEGNY